MLLAIAVIDVLTVVGDDVVGLFTSVSWNFQNIANQTAQLVHDRNDRGWPPSSAPARKYRS